MGLAPITKKDILKQLNRAGVTKGVQASQALEAFQLYINSEIPKIGNTDAKPLFIRQGVIMVKTSSPAVSHIIKQHEIDILKYLNQTTSLTVKEIRFRA